MRGPLAPIFESFIKVRAIGARREIFLLLRAMEAQRRFAENLEG